ncbi:phage terminase large subunit, partial [Bacillus thuringiensis]
MPRDSSGALLFERIVDYTDTADSGDDYLCSITFGIYQGHAYVLDVLYTQEDMEETENDMAYRMNESAVNVVYIESNNGGEGYARSVRRILKTNYPKAPTIVRSFHQSKNKQARILSNSTFVMQRVLFPVGWRDRWPEYYKDMSDYQREGKNLHDDAPDATTGVAEVLQNRVSAQEKEEKKGRPNR